MVAVVIGAMATAAAPARARPAPAAKARPAPAAPPAGKQLPEPPPAPSAPPSPSAATLGGVDAFGSHAVAADELVAAAGLTVGEPFGIDDPTLKDRVDAAAARIRARWRFAFVELSPIWYFGPSPMAGKAVVTIDVVDVGDEARLRFAAAPTGHVDDPDGLVAAWIDYEARAQALVDAGTLDVGKCAGGLHCALGFGHPSLAGVEDRFIAGAPKQLRALCDLLRHDASAERRAAAAFVLAYAGDAAQVVAALAPSIDDPESLVRNNVVRVLLMIQQQQATPVLPLAPLLRALRFPLTTDRNKAAYALDALVATAPDRFRDAILAADGDVLAEMTALVQPNNRDPAVSILTRLAGKDLGSPAAWRAWVDAQRAARAATPATPATPARP